MVETAEQRRQRILQLTRNIPSYDSNGKLVNPEGSGWQPPPLPTSTYTPIFDDTGNISTPAPSDTDIQNALALAKGQTGRPIYQSDLQREAAIKQSTQPSSNMQIASYVQNANPPVDYGPSDEELRSQYDLSPSNLAVNIARQAAANQSLSRNAVDEQQMTGYRAGTPFMYPTDPNAKSTGYGYNSENTDDSDQFKPVAASNYSPVNIQNAKTQALQVLNSPRQALASTTTPTAKQDIWANRNNVPTPPTRPTSGPAAASQPGFFSRLFSGDNYQSNNQLVAPKGSKDPTEINWGNSDSAADFLRASQALQKMDPNYVANNADDTFDNGNKRGGAVKEKKHDPLHHALSLISHILGHKHQ